MATYVCPGEGCTRETPKPSNTAHHTFQSHSRWDSYSTALEAVEQHNENRQTAEGSDDDPPGVGSKYVPDNPLWEMPDHRSSGRPPCPACGDSMERIGGGQTLTATDRESGETHMLVTDDDDVACRDCKILADDGDTYGYE